MSKHEGHRSAMDGAIDRAVREMMHADPRPGLKDRVLRRLDERASGAWLGGPVAPWMRATGLLAAAVLVVVVAASMYREAAAPPPPQVQAAASAGAPELRPDPPEPTFVPVPAEAVPQPQRPPRQAEPTPEAIFGAQTGQVRAADTSHPGASAGQEAAAAKPGAVASARAASQPANVHLQLTITDQRDGMPSVPKTVSVVVTHGQLGRIRAGSGDVVLNVDARPEILPDGRIRVHVSLDYRPAPPEGEKPGTLDVTKRLSAILDDGKSMVLSQSADPASTRTVQVALKATVLK